MCVFKIMALQLPQGSHHILTSRRLTFLIIVIMFYVYYVYLASALFDIITLYVMSK